MQLIRLLVCLLPASPVKNRLMSLCSSRWHVASTATVRPCIVWQVRELTVGDHAHVGFGNVFRSMRRVLIGSESEIHQFNEFTATAQWTAAGSDMAGTLELAAKSGITTRHFMECSGGVTIGELAVVGGFKSMFITRQMDIHHLRQVGKPIKVGRLCMIAANVTVVPGVTISDRCVVAAGSVVPKDLPESGMLYAGNPVKAVRSVADAPFLNRTEQRAVSMATVDSMVKQSRQG